MRWRIRLTAWPGVFVIVKPDVHMYLSLSKCTPHLIMTFFGRQGKDLTKTEKVSKWMGGERNAIMQKKGKGEIPVLLLESEHYRSTIRRVALQKNISGSSRFAAGKMLRLHLPGAAGETGPETAVFPLRNAGGGRGVLRR